MISILPANVKNTLVHKLECKCGTISRFKQKVPLFCGKCGEKLIGTPTKEVLVTPVKISTATSAEVYKIICSSCNENIRYNKVNGQRPSFCATCGTDIRYHNVREELIIIPKPLKALSKEIVD